MTFTYEIDSSIDLRNIIDVLKKELNLKEGQIGYFSLEEDDNVEEILPIDELKEKAMEIFFGQDCLSLVFPGVEVNVGEDKIEIESKIKLALKGVDVDNVLDDLPPSTSSIKLNLNNLKFEDLFKSYQKNYK